MERRAEGASGVWGANRTETKEEDAHVCAATGCDISGLLTQILDHGNLNRIESPWAIRERSGRASSPLKKIGQETLDSCVSGARCHPNLNSEDTKKAFNIYVDTDDPNPIYVCIRSSIRYRIDKIRWI